MAKVNHIIDSPKAVDAVIQRIQTFFFDKLQWPDFEIFGRTYKVATDNGFVPRAFESGRDYKDVFTDDKVSARIFFITDNQHTTKQGVLFTAKVKMVFMVNLKKLFPDATKRADTDVQIQAIELINKMKAFNFNGEIETDIADVFKGFNVQSIPKADLQPYHVFSLNGEINYTIAGDGCSK